MQSLTQRILAAALVLAAAAAQSAPLRNPTITDLGALGSAGARATALNNRGDIVGYSPTRLLGSPTEVDRAFLWQNGLLQEIGAPVSLFSQATSVNDRGTIAVNGDGKRAFLWKDGQWIDMHVFGTPYAVNRFDAVTGMHATGAGPRAFLWENGALRDLGTLGGTASVGMALNDKGMVVGGSTVAGNGATHAFAYQDGIMRDLGTLGGRDSFALGVNDHGVVVGYSDVDDEESVAFVWDGARMRRLLAAPGPHYASAINNQGTIVGATEWGSFHYHNGVVTRLEVFPNVRAAGWTRLYPTGINDLGWVVGYGYRQGVSGPRAFLLKPR